MKNWYTKEAGVLESPDKYLAPVDVTVFGPASMDEKFDLEGPGKLYIDFNIEVEARSWGIKDIGVFVDGVVKVPIYVNDSATNRLVEERSVDVDLSKIKKEESDKSGIVTLGDLTLYLDGNFNVDYNNSSLEIIK